jgi:hypothetical protein
VRFVRVFSLMLATCQFSTKNYEHLFSPFCASILINGKAVDKRTNVSMVK